MKDYYSALKILPTATTEEIRKAYRVLALKFHPDVCKAPDAHVRFLEIGEAYEILSNYSKRVIYDAQYQAYRNRDNNFQIDTEYERWQNEAKQTAQRHSEMSYSEFKLKILDSLVVVYDKTKSFAKSLVMLLFGLYLLFLVSKCFS